MIPSDTNGRPYALVSEVKAALGPVETLNMTYEEFTAHVVEQALTAIAKSTGPNAPVKHGAMMALEGRVQALEDSKKAGLKLVS